MGNRRGAASPDWTRDSSALIPTGESLTSVPLWGVGEELVPFLEDLPGPPFELADAFGRALDTGVEVRGIVVPGTRDLTYPVDLIRENFPYLSWTST